MTTIDTRVLIVGAGAAGYTAAIYAARANLRPVLVTGLQPGGQLTITTDVENFPGFAEPVQGPDLMEAMRAQAERVGTRVVYDTITSVDVRGDGTTAVGDSGDRYEAEALIVATGAQARWLGVPGEAEFSGVGVSACATCDGVFFRDRSVVVVGGGNVAVEEALYLTRHAREVTLVHRRDALRAERVLQDRLLAHPKVTVVWDSVVEEVVGRRSPVPAVEGVRLRDVRTGERRVLAADGVFVAIGHDPATGLFRGQLPMDEHGYLAVAPWSTRLGVGLAYGAGDAADPTFKQAAVAAAMGCMAALEAERDLAERDHARRAAATVPETARTPEHA